MEIMPAKIFVTLNYMASVEQILVFDGSRSYLLLKGMSASEMCFILNILYQEDFTMYDSRAVYDVILSSIDRNNLPEFDPEEAREVIKGRLEKASEERERRNMSGI